MGRINLTLEEADALLEARDRADIYDKEIAVVLKGISHKFRGLVEIGEPKINIQYWGDQAPYFGALATHRGIANEV